MHKYSTCPAFCSKYLPAKAPSRFLLVLASWLTLTSLLLAPRLQAQPASLNTLRSGHPRLHFTPEKVAAVRSLIQTDSRAINGYNSLKAKGEAYLNNLTFKYDQKKDGPDKHDNTWARQELTRMQTLAGLYVLDGDTRWFNKAKADLLSMATFPSWGPPANQELETSALTIAMAIGYDWLYSGLSATERTMIKNAIISLGLSVGRSAYTTNSSSSWIRAPHNWGQIVNAGMGIGALAIADEDPELAQYILTNVRDNLGIVMKDIFAPNGGGDEGINYWSYGLQYNVYLLDAAQTALGTDWGMSLVPGLSETGYYPMHMLGPVKSSYIKSFNYADQGDNGSNGSDELVWLAKRFNNPTYAQYALGTSGSLSNVYSMLAYAPDLFATPAPQVPKDSYYRRMEVATLRGSWTDANTFYVGFKAGSNAFSHAHLEIGTFVLDALGQRWAVDIGLDNYGLPYYFGNNFQGAKRWTYYRTRTEGQNTLSISANTQQPLAFANQYCKGQAPITKFQTSAAKSLVVTDMTDAYRAISGDARAVTKAHRGIMLLNNEQVLVQDEVTAGSAVEVIWHMHTAATVSLAGTTATLVQGGKTLKAQILSPAGAVFETLTANPPAKDNDPNTLEENPNAGIQKLIVRLPGKVTNTTIRVRFLPASSTAAAPVAETLANWKLTGAETEAPTAPASLAVIGKYDASISLAWTASTDNVGVTGYNVYNGTTLVGYTSGTSLAVSDLVANTTYTFTVRARDAAGNLSAASNPVTVATLAAPDTQAPTAPANLAVSTTTGESVALSWSSSTDNVGVSGYEVYALYGSTNALTLAGTTTGATATTYTVTDLMPHTAYKFIVKAKDMSGKASANSNAVEVTTLAPDLVVTNINWERSSPFAGTPVVFSATVKNQGTAPSPAGLIHGVTFKVNGDLKTWAQHFTESIPVNGEVVITASAGDNNSINWTPTAVDTYSVAVEIDGAGRITETNEANNGRTETIAAGLAPQHDTHVRSGTYANTTYGTEGTLLLKTEAITAGDYNRDAYFKFDVSSVSAISSAKLRFYASLRGSADVTLQVYKAGNALAGSTTAWTETNLKWSNKPALVGANLVDDVVVTAGTDGWYQVDVTGYVQAQKAAGASVSLLLHATTQVTDGLAISSKESPAKEKPSLEIDQSSGSRRNALSASPLAEEAAQAVSQALRLYPTPVKSHETLTLQYYAAQAGVALVRVVDLQGRLLLLHQLAAQAGDNRVQLPVDLPAGVYLLQVETAGSLPAPVQLLVQ